MTLNYPTITATFENPGKAESAVADLWHEGFTHEQVGFVVDGNHVVQAQTPIGRIEDSGATGAVEGAIAGGVLGALAGVLMVALLPGLGAILTGGLLVGIATAAALGAALGTFLGPFVALEMSKKVAVFLKQADLKEGCTVVVVKPESPERATKARAILAEFGGNENPALSPIDRTTLGTDQHVRADGA